MSEHRLSLREGALKAGTWTTGGFAVPQVIRLGSNLILTRLLFLEAFGLMSIVYVLMTGLAFFSDLGINQSIIQNRRGDEPDFIIGGNVFGANRKWTIMDSVMLESPVNIHKFLLARIIEVGTHGLMGIISIDQTPNASLVSWFLLLADDLFGRSQYLINNRVNF